MTDESAPQTLDEKLAQMTLDTIHGDLTTAMIEELQNAHDVWQKLSEGDQEDVIERIQSKAEHFIRRITYLISNRGFKSCTAAIEQVTFKDGTKVVMKTFNRDGGHQLADHVDSSVLIIFADPAEYLNGGEMPEPDKDQPDLLDEQKEE